MQATCCRLAQVCLAYRSDGGRVVVVLCSRDKLEMEALFRRTIPQDSRYGTQFVFRQVLPYSLVLHGAAKR